MGMNAGHFHKSFYFPELHDFKISLFILRTNISFTQGNEMLSPAGIRNHGRSLKRLLDTWDRNGSTSGPTPWKIYDDDDDDDDDNDDDE